MRELGTGYGNLKHAMLARVHIDSRLVADGWDRRWGVGVAGVCAKWIGLSADLDDDIAVRFICPQHSI